MADSFALTGRFAGALADLGLGVASVGFAGQVGALRNGTTIVSAPLWLMGAAPGKN